MNQKVLLAGFVSVACITAIISFMKIKTIEYNQPSKKSEIAIHLEGGRELPVARDGHVLIPSPSVLENLGPADLENLYLRYLGSIQSVCRRQTHLGDNGDGGYDVCEDDDVVPVKPCVAYSFGIRNDFSFDDAMARLYGCEVHCFDPANGMKDHQRSNLIFFHSFGIGDRDEINSRNMSLKTFSTIRRYLGHAKTDIPVVKIDIEGGEWVSLPEMITSGVLQGVKQLLLEFHSFVHFRSWHVDIRNVGDYRKNLNTLRHLYDEGFRIFYFRRFHGPACFFKDSSGAQRTGCMEVHFKRELG